LVENEKMKTKITLTLIIITIFSTSSFASGRIWKNDPFSTNKAGDTSFSSGTNKNYEKISFSEDNPEVLVQGIWQVGKIYKAMISDTIVNVGMKVNGYLVQSINSKRIVLRSSNSGKLLVLKYEE
jgi:hypothetical protein